MDQCKTPEMQKLRSVLQCDKLVIPESPQMDKLGYGTGVSVYRMKRSPKVGMYQSPWAVKRVFHTYMGSTYSERLTSEANILKKLNHPNIVGFRAFVKAEDGRDCLAMEECDTSVADLIEMRSEDGLGPFQAEKILKVALDIGKALDYLHRVCHLLHGDIKSLNILVKGDFEIVKLCDFGVSVPLNADGVLDTDDADVEYIGTSNWAAPEAVCSDGPTPITNKADIFSFGLVLWEMITLRTPHCDESSVEEVDTSEVAEEGASDDTSFMSSPDTSVSAMIGLKCGTRPPLPDSPLGEEYIPVIMLFNSCTEEDFKKRPSAKEIVEQLETLSSNSSLVAALSTA
ncbi:lymphokine-activated killer T-cell-originated protein kinase-like isoform X2 [Zootermopsis nevadensis]|uniref:lymphokine-activated killer T-cell-originated protein kinase-like isoform X2 n=1 Tax=Zootermopsis nevadensis TaxID=136037 RepID=UPI000B8EE0CC|nr:lymphokine-activated killer T-cell-originated protein kinase-like isoform X2 [Zootermopsis nevadensis]